MAGLLMMYRCTFPHKQEVSHFYAKHLALALVLDTYYLNKLYISFISTEIHLQTFVIYIFLIQNKIAHPGCAHYVAIINGSL